MIPGTLGGVRQKACQPDAQGSSLARRGRRCAVNRPVVSSRNATVPLELSLQRAILLLLASVLLVALVPAGIALDRRLATELEDRASDELLIAPRILAARSRAIEEGLAMHAKEIARAPGLADAIRRNDRTAALRLMEAARDSFGTGGILVGPEGERWSGPLPDPALVQATRERKSPVGIATDAHGVYSIALAPVEGPRGWVGAAGVAIALDSVAANMLGGLTHAEVVIADGTRAVAASAGAEGIATALARVESHADGSVSDAIIAAERHLVVRAALGGGASVVFARQVRRETAVGPTFRRLLLLTGVAAIAAALSLGALLAGGLARPVGMLADAADRIAAGDFEAPLERSSMREVRRVVDAFEAMRRAMRLRLDDLGDANRTLADRQERLMSLQAELIHRERQSASSRLVAELAHEIRNPVANLRNCLELVRRRVHDDADALRFTNMAIDELLRMHELAERMLDLNRPRESVAGTCDAVRVAREVAAFTRVGLPPNAIGLSIVCDGDTHAAIAPDMLKQVLLNLVQNARDARPEGLQLGIDIRCPPELVRIEVSDNGPGIKPDVLPRIFDPFFTSKGMAGGIGLGLFLADGIVRKHGGRISASNREDGEGALFVVDIPAGVRVGVPDTA